MQTPSVCTVNPDPPAPPLNIYVSGARGGHGASTVAAAIALMASELHATELVAHDPATTAALLGLATPADHESIPISESLLLTAEASHQAPVVVHDLGTERGDEPGIHLVVLRGPCYLGLRSMMASPLRQPFDVVLLAEPGRSLTSRDVEDILWTSVVATIPVAAAVARSIDAGLLAARHGQLRELSSLRRYLTTILPIDADQASTTPEHVPSTDPADAPTIRPENPIKFGTDLPVPLSGTGRGSRPGRVRVVERASPSCEESRRAGSTTGVEHREAGPRRRRVLHRVGGDVGRGLLHRPR